MSTPIALWLAEKLEDPESAHGYRLVANNAADELRRLYQENEQLKAQRKPLTDEVIFWEYQRIWPFHPAEEPTLAKAIVKFARAIEAAHGIKENT